MIDFVTRIILTVLYTVVVITARDYAIKAEDPCIIILGGVAGGVLLASLCIV